MVLILYANGGLLDLIDTLATVDAGNPSGPAAHQ